MNTTNDNLVLALSEKKNYYSYAVMILLLPLSTMLSFTVWGQSGNRSDSINFSKLHFTHNKFINKVFQQAINSVKKNSDTVINNNLNAKSEDPFKPYQGKIIRHIYIRPLGINQSFIDSNARDTGFAAKIGDKFHRTTRKFVIKNNLFIKENTPVNAFKLADNERYIRSLEFLHDARIVVDTIPGDSDSVDVIVYTKDVFSIGGGAASNGLNHINLDLYDANLLGMGQRVEMTGLYDYTRSPTFGYGGFYRKNSVAHSFADVTVGYSNMNISDYTHEEETIEYISISRRLASPYSRYAGGMTWSHSDASNLYHLPAIFSFPYKYSLYDIWAGYNIGIKKLNAANNSKRDSRFLSFRYYDRDFQQIPVQAGNNFDPVFNSSYALLAQFTFFRQDYYKTQYVYGFGTTEDLPYGYNIAVTAGWHKQLELKRPYAGINASRYIATRKGDFIQAYLRTGGFLDKNKLEDASYLFGATAFSRIIFWHSTKIRQYINVNFTSLYNRVTYAPLRIDNYFGIRGFLSDSASGSRRLTIQTETEFYLKFRFLGFQFAPFPWYDIALLTPENLPYTTTKLHTALGGGIRARNENLVFETIELRVSVFPAAPKDMRGFKVDLNSNIRYRYISNYIVAPDIVQLNTQ
jgi:hypothetical protein